MRTAAVFFLFLLSGISACPAAPASAPTSAAEPGAELSVYLMTMSAGSAIYERFGHNALVIRNSRTESAIAYNWGMFSFEQSNFVWRFLHGRLEYWMEGFDAGQMLAFYKEDDRTIWLDELNLSPAQRLRLRNFLEWNARPENRSYRYDYYRDNCSTRVRDAIDLALGGQLQAQLDPRPAGTTFRWHTRRLTADNLFWFTALTFVLGHAVDEPLSQWQDAFLPLNLRAYMLTATVTDAAGTVRPLVGRQIQAATSSRPPQRAASPNWTLQYGLAGTALGGAMVLLAIASNRRRWAAVVLALLACVWAIVAGAGGAIASYGWVATDHAASWRNENLLQLPPLSLLLIPLAPLAVWGGRKNLTAARWLAAIIAAMSLLGFLIQIVPGMNQANGEIIALALPTNVGLAVALYRRNARRAAAAH